MTEKNFETKVGKSIYHFANLIDVIQTCAIIIFFIIAIISIINWLSFVGNGKLVLDLYENYNISDKSSTGFAIILTNFLHSAFKVKDGTAFLFVYSLLSLITGMIFIKIKEGIISMIQGFACICEVYVKQVKSAEQHNLLQSEKTDTIKSNDN